MGTRGSFEVTPRFIPAFLSCEGFEQDVGGLRAESPHRYLMVLWHSGQEELYLQGRIYCRRQ